MTTTTFQDIGFGTGKLQDSKGTGGETTGFWARLLKTMIRAREGEVRRRIAVQEFSHLNDALLRDIGIEPGTPSGLPASVRADFANHC